MPVVAGSHGHQRQQPLIYMGELMDNVCIYSQQQASVVVGDFFEEATRALFGGDKFCRCKMDGDYCPDVVDEPRREVFVEAKARGIAGKRFMVYKWQVERYDEMFSAYFPELPDVQVYDPILIYALWKYRVDKVGSFADRDSLRAALAGNIEYCLLLGQEVMKRIVESKRTKEFISWFRSTGDYVEIYDRDLQLVWEKNFPALRLKYKMFGANCFMGERLCVGGVKAYDFDTSSFQVGCCLEKICKEKESLRKILGFFGREFCI